MILLITLFVEIQIICSYFCLHVIHCTCNILFVGIQWIKNKQCQVVLFLPSFYKSHKGIENYCILCSQYFCTFLFLKKSHFSDHCYTMIHLPLPLLPACFPIPPLSECLETVPSPLRQHTATVSSSLPVQCSVFPQQDRSYKTINTSLIKSYQIKVHKHLPYKHSLKTFYWNFRH